MSLNKRIKAFVQLGLFLKQFENSSKSDLSSDINKRFYTDFEKLIINQKAYNGWFTKENVLSAVTQIALVLSKEKIDNWLNTYTIKDKPTKIIGVIMAGNIPLVGFYDMLYVLISGNVIHAKLASNDNTLIKKIAEILIFIESDFSDKIVFVERLEKFDGVIATGSNNTSRYFEQYFSRYPHIIRKNRNSIAIISKNDSQKDLKGLGEDIFKYFGLGCRSVSKLFIPTDYKIDTFFEAIFDDYSQVTQNNKYANNYDYNKAVYLLGNNKLLDNGFLLMKEEQSLYSPVGVLNYEYYNSTEELKEKIEVQKDNIQCIVSSNHTPLETLNFGESQYPKLCDYADGVDVVDFLLKL